MDEEVVVHIYNGILLSHKKEHISVISSEEDELESESESHSVVSDSLQLHALYSPWNSLGQNTDCVAFPFSRGSSQPRDQTQVFHIAGIFFTS